MKSQPVSNEVLGSDYIDPRSLEEVPRPVGLFCEVVTHLGPEPRELPVTDSVHLYGQTEHSWSQEVVDVISRIVDAQPYGRLYVDSSVNESLLHGKTQHVRLSRTSVAETSAHQVFFAKMTGYNGCVRVAVKPHENGTERLYAEWVNATIAKKLGFGAFSALGIIRTQEGGYMLTARRDDVEPLDNADWESVLSEPERNGAMLEELEQVGPLLARLHDQGGFHCDPQLKNFVVDEKGMLDLIDWESGKFYARPQWGNMLGGKEDQLLSGALRDLKILFGSLARSTDKHGVGLLHGYTTTAQWSFFRQYVLNPYVEERMQLLGKYGHRDGDRALVHLTEVEIEMENYILDGRMYETLSRNANHAIKQDKA